MRSKLPHGARSSLLVEACKERRGKLQRKFLRERLEPEGLLDSAPPRSSPGKVIWNRLV